MDFIKKGGNNLKKLISFVGTGNYQDCIYTRGDGFKSQPTKYIQTALFEMLEYEKENIDQVYIFITDEAKRKHYDDVEMQDGSLKKGLYSIWKEMFPKHKNKLKPIHISSDQSEKGQWELFENIYEVIEKDDEIYFDITHSFRSVPMIALLVANFAKIIKGAKINRLFYGNFEVLFDLANSLDKNLEDIELEKKKAPIVDITSMLNLMDWSTGVEAFLETGNPKQISKLAEERFVENYDKDILKIKKLTDSLYDLHQHMETSRGIALQEKIAHVIENIEAAKRVSEETLPQFSKLMSEVEGKIELFTYSDKENMWGIIKWCAEHGLYQQAYTFAVEFAISVVYQELVKLDIFPKTDNLSVIRDQRKAISSIIHVTCNPKGEYESEFLKENGYFIKPAENFIKKHKNAFDNFQSINEYRNNINHAEKAQEEITIDRIKSRLDGFVAEIKPLFVEDK